MAENQKVGIGRIVHYVLTESDVGAIEQQRAVHNVHGNPANAGDEVPMLVVAVWGPDCANGRLMLDGQDDLWVTSRMGSSGPVAGCWHWPERA